MRMHNLQVLTKLSHHAIIADADGYEFAAVWNAGEQCGETEVRERALQLARQMAAAPRLESMLRDALDELDGYRRLVAPGVAPVKPIVTTTILNQGRALLAEITGQLPPGWREATPAEIAAGFARYQHDESGAQSETWPDVTDV